MRPGMPGSHLAPPVPEACVGSEGVCAGDTAIAVAPEDEGSTGTDMDRKQGQHDVGDPPGDNHDGFSGDAAHPNLHFRSFANPPLQCALLDEKRGRGRKGNRGEWRDAACSSAPKLPKAE